MRDDRFICLCFYGYSWIHWNKNKRVVFWIHALKISVKLGIILNMFRSYPLRKLFSSKLQIFNILVYTFTNVVILDLVLKALLLWLYAVTIFYFHIYILHFKNPKRFWDLVDITTLPVFFCIRAGARNRKRCTCKYVKSIFRFSILRIPKWFLIYGNKT